MKTSIMKKSMTVPYRVGQWLPSDQSVLDAWLARHIKLAEADQRPLHPVIQRLQDLIEGDAEIFMLFNLMF